MSAQLDLNRRMPGRSISSGALHSSCSPHRGFTPGPSPIRPLHKPLRSVHENSVLLQSPGALESMLKTTTETGNIGIFSIKPVPPSPDTRSTCSRNSRRGPRPSYSINSRMESDDRNAYFPRRDGTSEIVSMYTSGSQKSATSSTLPSNSTAEYGQRSYSMTTCGSRHLSHHRSTATLQSQTSSSYLQRPRSPFPYPTRLKRPGVRPASPALTENGNIDYSRMVEIDRASSRTNGYQKPVFSGRRPPPLRLRTNTNQSLPPMLGRASPFIRSRPPSYRSASVASVASRHGSTRRRYDTSSTRASSLTSVANMYNRMPPPLRVSHSGFPAAPPRYYDYTEDFEPTQYSPTFHQAMVPTPMRAHHSRRPFMFLADPEENYTSSLGERDSAFFETDTEDDMAAMPLMSSPSYHSLGQHRASSHPFLRREPSSASHNMIYEPDSFSYNQSMGKACDIDMLPSQVGRDSMDTFNPNLDIESRDVIAYNYADYRATTLSKTKIKSPERQVQLQDCDVPTIRSEQGVILRDDSPELSWTAEGSSSTPEFFNDVGSTATESANELGDEKLESPVVIEIHDVEETEASDEYSPLTSPPKSTDHHILVETSEVDDQKSIDQTRSDDGNISCSSGGMLKQLGGNVIEKTPQNEHLPDQSEQDDSKGQYRRHKRAPAALRISTTGLNAHVSEKTTSKLTTSCSTTPLIAPQPISPARQLKVKNSIPQLMKALPPLPGDSNPSYTSNLGTWGEEQFREVLQPFKFSRPKTSTIEETSFSADQGAKPSGKFRQKKGNSWLQLQETDDVPEQKTTEERQKRRSTPVASARLSKRAKKNESTSPQAPGRTKLQLQESRNFQTGSSSSGTVRHNPAAHGSDIPDLSSQQPKDLFNLSGNFTCAVRGTSRRLSQASSGDTKGTNRPMFGSCRPRRSHGQSIQQDESSMWVKTDNGRVPKGLRRRPSHIQYELQDCDEPLVSAADGNSNANTNQEYWFLGARKPKFRISIGSDSSQTSRLTLGKRARVRLSLLVRGAKAAVKSCVKRTARGPKRP